MFRGVTSAHCFLSSACYCMNCDGWELLQTCITGGNRGRQNFMVTGIVLVAKRQEQYVVSKQLVKTHYNRLYGHSLKIILLCQSSTGFQVIGLSKKQNFYSGLKDRIAAPIPDIGKQSIPQQLCETEVARAGGFTSVQLS